MDDFARLGGRRRLDGGNETLRELDDLGGAAVADGEGQALGSCDMLDAVEGVSVGSRPAIVPFGGGLLGVFATSTTSFIESTVFTPGAMSVWSPPSTIPAVTGSDAAATEMGAPGLAVLGATAHLVYEGSNDKFYHGVYSGSAWGPASDPVGGSGSSQAFGPPAAAATAAVGTTLYAAYDGGNGGLYVTTWTGSGSSGSWTPAVGIMMAGVATAPAVPPTMIALTGGAADLMLVYEVPATNLLYSVVHTPGGSAGTWAAPVEVNAAASSATAVSLAPLTGGGVVMVYLGKTDSFPYYSLYSPSASPAWTAPAKVDPNSLPLASAPTVTSGAACGVDAIAALAEPAGVELVTLAAGHWAAPVLVPGTASMTYATVATY